MERGVARDEGKLAWAERPAAGELLAAAQRKSRCRVPYESEIGLVARAWMQLARRAPRARRDPGHRLRLSAARVLPPAALDGHADVPLPPPRARRPVLPARAAGHHRARRFQRPRARGAREAGLEVLGYASQAQFLVNCGITDLLAREDAAERAALRAARRGGAEAALARGDGRALQGARGGARRRRARCSALRRRRPFACALGHAAILGFSSCSLPALAHADEIAEAKKRWSESPHGPMLERILPPTFEARQLPEPGLAGRAADAALLRAMPQPAQPGDARRRASGRGIVERMVPRMQGKGNMGKLMADMMAGREGAGRRRRRRRSSPTCASTRRSRSTRRSYPGGQRAVGRAVPPRLQPVPRAARSAAPHRDGVARGGGAHAGEHGVDEPRGRHASPFPASRSSRSRTINAFLQYAATRGGDAIGALTAAAYVQVNGHRHAARDRRARARWCRTSASRAGNSARSTLCHSWRATQG